METVSNQPQVNAVEEVAKIEREIKGGNEETNPKLNPKAISIIQQNDGNWKGKCQKNGKLVEARTNDPQTVLLELLTHE